MKLTATGKLNEIHRFFKTRAVGKIPTTATVKLSAAQQGNFPI